jgi:hypothetical protein
LLLSIKSVQAGEIILDSYSDSHWHENQEITDVGIAGMVLGFTSLFGCLIYAIVTITKDAMNTHRVYDKQLYEARERMKVLGLNLDKVDA